MSSCYIHVPNSQIASQIPETASRWMMTRCTKDAFKADTADATNWGIDAGERRPTELVEDPDRWNCVFERGQRPREAERCKNRH